MIEISIKKQKLKFIKDFEVVKEYPISTSINGIGNEEGSEKTPIGRHQICEKIGDGVAIGTVFQARKNKGIISRIYKSREEYPYEEESSCITTRILRLMGTQRGVNLSTKEEGIDTFQRFIYIHGTPYEYAIGTPCSKGCIRMRNEDIAELFEFVKDDEKVVIAEEPLERAYRLNNAIEEELGTLFRQLGTEPIVSRYGEVDIAYPASEDEYCILGGHSVVMIVAMSEYKEELPLERAYFQLRDKRIIPLNELGVCVDGSDVLGGLVTEKQYGFGRICFENISFWTIPTVWFIDDEGFIAVDFKGERKEFIIKRGPWKLHSIVREYISKNITGQIKVAEHVPYDVVAKFIEREFFKSNRV